MTKQPKEIIIAKLEVVVMPNGEIICMGKTVGWFKDLAKYLSQPKDGITGEPVNEE